MKHLFLCTWLLIIAIGVADQRLGRPEDRPYAPRSVPHVSTHFSITGQRDLVSMQFHRQVRRAAARAGTLAQRPTEIWGVPLMPPRGRDGAHAVQRTVLAALGTSGTDDASWISTAVDEASPGDVVHVPAGCFEIKSMIALPEGISLVGAGAARTILYRRASLSEDTVVPLILMVGPDAPGASRVSGIAFISATFPGDVAQDAGIEIHDGIDFRIDSCYFQSFGMSGVLVTGDSRGVVDHCVFVDNYKPDIGNVGYGVAVLHDNVWDEQMNLGTAEATFIEDCIFAGCRHAITSNAGAHYVFRHNLVEEGVVSHPVDAHGPGYGSERGTRCVEIYRNTIRDPRHGPDTGEVGQRPTDIAILIRGGGGVIFDNIIHGYVEPIQCVLEFGTPEELRGSYPWPDQVHDLWIWDNRDEEGICVPNVNGYDKSREYIVLDRDYFSNAKADYVPFPYPHPLTQR